MKGRVCMEEIMILNEITLKINGEPLLKTERLGIRKNEVIAIVGKNGAGKTSLLNVITKEFPEYDGQIESLLSLEEMMYVKQEVMTYEEDKENYQQSSLNRKWRKQAGFDHLSGGEKLKKRLQAGFAANVPLLLLDEPTNHLDETSVAELISTVKSYRGALVLVSHDRYFLDQVATTIWSIEDGKVKAYPGNYSNFAKLRGEERLRQEREFEQQEKEINRVKAEMQQLTNWSASAHAQSTKKAPRQIGAKEYFRMKAKRMDSHRKSIEKRLQNQLDSHTVERVKDEYTVQFDLDVSKQKNGPLFLGEGLEKKYGKKVILKASDLSIMFGERVAITGDNGSGKTTLLKILLGEESFTGKLWQSEFAEIGYLSQEVFDLPDELRIADYFVLDRDDLGPAMTLFVHLGFRVEQWQQAIALLSMGERVKLKLMSHIISQKNVLILDEPTNHLDIPAREELEKVLASYQGTLIFVSHDRYFREKVSQRNLLIENQKIVDLSAQIADELPVDKLLLEFQRDQLLGKLSTISPGHEDYDETNDKFNVVIKKLQGL